MKLLNIKKQFIKTIFENNLISQGNKIIIALSGGPDSVALFHLLNEIKDEYELKLYFAHINHMLRGEHSDLDEQFVRDLGKAHNVDVFIKRENIKEYSKREKIGEEEAGRKIRYEFFEEIKTQISADKVALAHNLDDNVETFLFRMMRGSSLDGLTAIPIKRDIFVRPLLNTYKKDILHYLKENNLGFRVDESNNKNIYTRNKIRLDLIPYIEKEFNSNFKENIINLISEVKDISTLFQEKIEELIPKKRIKLKEIDNFSNYFKRKLINEKLKSFDLNINRNKIEEIISILTPDGSKEINIGKGYFFYKEYDEFYIDKKRENIEKNEIKLSVGESVFFNGFKIKLTETKNIEKIDKKDENTFFIDYNNVIGNEFVIRTRRAGDYFTPLGKKFRKKLKDFFINEKIDRYSRNILPIILNNDRIVCVGNIKMSDEFKISDRSERLVKIELKEGDNYGK